MAESDVLRPDVVVDANGERTIGGRSFDLHVTDGAVSDADLWLYDATSGVAVIGDLVTFPAPFFETACPARWREALDAVRAVPFKLAIPGHGEPMDRAQFDTLARRIQRIHGLCREPGRRGPVCGRLGDRHCSVHRRG